ncbi:MAG TPA: DinB family protein [Mycobacteriales bacterium]|nr:DinB family protein [Mycobacteriales bacterium]
MTSAELLAEAFNRIQQEVHSTLEGLGPRELAERVDGERTHPQANTIAWLVWHLTRVQDDHVADVAGRKQVWHEGGWVDKFGLPFDREATGYGQNSVDVGAVKPQSADLLVGYYDEVHARTLEYVEQLSDRDLERVVDDSYDPPVTLGTRLISVISDDLQHIGQAAYVRGLLTREAE